MVDAKLGYEPNTEKAPKDWKVKRKRCHYHSRCKRPTEKLLVQEKEELIFLREI